jgi:S1-C subfamily serine protease
MNMNMISEKILWPRRLVFLAPTCLLLGTATVCRCAGTSDLPDIRRDATVLAIEQVMPSVVNIRTRTIVPVRDQFDALYRQLMRLPNSYISLGSGVIIDEAGYLLTNDHVVRRAQEIQVQLNDASSTNCVYLATVVASDPKSDVALLKLEAPPGRKFHAIKFAADDDLFLGETVLALGNPLGLGGSVTRGILSSKSRSAPLEGEPLTYRNWLQTDAPINPGNSGGPLVNLRGELIGINAQLLEYNGQPAQGIGFAIPIRLVETALAEILPTEFVKSFWFGARVKVGTSPLVIASVQPDSPAGQAGLKAGDAVLQVNGKAPRSFIDFADLLAAGAASDVTVTVRRGSEQNDFAVRLVPETSVFNATMVRDKLGLQLVALTPEEVARRYHVNAPGGFAITGVQEGSPGARANLQSGMLVLSVDDQAPGDVTALAKWLHRKKRGERVELELASWQRVGDFNVLRQDTVDLTPR